MKISTFYLCRAISNGSMGITKSVDINVCLAYFIIWVVWSFLKMYEWDHPYAFINMKTIKKKKDE